MATDLTDVPDREHWNSCGQPPHDFDANDVWTWAQRRRSGDKQTWICVFCKQWWYGWNATKVLYHHACIRGHGIEPCRAFNTGTMPQWFHDAIHQVIRDKESAKSNRKQVRINVISFKCTFLASYIVFHFFCSCSKSFQYRFGKHKSNK